MTRSGAFVALSATLRSLAQQYGLQPRMLEQRLRRDWPAIVGEQIARHAQPETIRYKKLYVTVDHSGWLQHLAYLKPTLIEKLNAAAGEPIVTDVVMRVGEIAAQPADAQTSQAQPSAPPPALLAEAEGSAQALADPELRARWSTVMARALQPRPARTGRPLP